MTSSIHRLFRIGALAAVLGAAAPAAGQEKPAGPAVSVYGFALFDAFWSSGPFSNKDNANQVKVPTVADSGGSFLMSARGSRLGLRLDGLDPGALAASLSGVVEFDFKGGHFGSNSASWNAFGPRLRLAYARADWKSGTSAWYVLAGQDWGLLGNVNPNTVAYNCDPVFVQSGNVYRRSPQLRVGWELKPEGFGLAVAAGLLSPADADTQGQTGGSALDSGVGNRSRRPDVEARLAVSAKALGPLQGTVGVGVHLGERRYAFTSAGVGVHEDVTARLVSVDADLGLTSYLQLKGEFYSSEGAEDGYSGGFPATFPANPPSTGAPPASFQAVTSQGWWAQATAKPIPELWFTGGYGTARASRARLSTTAASTRYQNTELHGAVIYNASKNLRLGLELSRTESSYVVEGAFRANQVALGTQLLF